MPHRPIAYQQNLIFRIGFCQFGKIHIHTICVAVWQDQKETLTVSGFHCSIRIPIFTNMLTWNRGSCPFSAPAALGLIDSSETCFVLKHQPHILERVLGDNSGIQIVNFFEESCSSVLAAFGCFDLGMTFRHPCRFITPYI